MKKAILLIIAIAAVTLVSCSKIPKGGKIEVTNGLSTFTVVAVIKGQLNMVTEIVEKLQNEEGDVLQTGERKTYEFDEDGIYTVVAVPPLTPPFHQFVTLLADNTVTVTIQ